MLKASKHEAPLEMRFPIASSYRMEAQLSSTVHIDLPSIQESDANMETFPPEEDDSKVSSTRVMHFKPTKKDTLKASFTSFSFLLLIPLIASLYFKINDIFHVEEEAEGVISEIFSSWWLVFGIIIFLVVASAAFGIVSTFLKYGKYEISSDVDRIYITKGVGQLLILFTTIFVVFLEISISVY